MAFLLVRIKVLERTLFKHLYLLILLGCLGTGSCSRSEKLLVVLIDGFRWNYFPTPTDDRPSGFNEFISRGVKADYMMPAFPSLSLPNYYTLMTGRTPEHHGIVNNNMYDTQYASYYQNGFKLTFNDYWYEGGEPIWITAVNQGLRSEVHYFKTCLGELPGNKVVSCIDPMVHPTVSNIADTFQNVTKQFKNDKIDLAVVYFPNIDHLGHIYGPNSDELNNEIGRLDDAILKLHNSLKAETFVDGYTKLSDLVNVIFVSDHGMASLSEDRIANVTQYLNMEDVHVTAKGTVVYSIWPKEGKIDKVYEDLRNVSHAHVFRKQDLPARWHYRSHYHTPPITVVAEKGWLLLTPDQPVAEHFEENQNRMKKGDHGYDNVEADVQAIFVAAGPSFWKYKTIDPIASRDVYQVMCKVLDLHPADHDGDWRRVNMMFNTTESHCKAAENKISNVSYKTVIISGVLGMIFTAVVCAIVYVLYLRKGRIQYRYRKVANNEEEGDRFEL